MMRVSLAQDGSHGSATSKVTSSLLRYNKKIVTRIGG